MRTHDFIHVFAKHQVAHLEARVYVVDRLQGMSVPEADASISRASATRQQSVLVR